MEGMLLCDPHGCVFQPSTSPLPIGTSVSAPPQTCAYVNSVRAEKTPQLGATLPANTCCNIWIHESRLLIKECAAIRDALVWSMLPHWGRRKCGAIYALIDTSFRSFRANMIQLMCVFPRKVRDKENASVGVWACIEMCGLTSDWSVACIPPREDIGRGQTRLFQIDLSETAPGRPN